MNSVPVISGENFIRYSKYTDLAPDFVKALDPTGFNLISQEFVHNDAFEMRLVVLFKLANREDPVYGTVTIRTGVFNKIKENYTLNDSEVS